jgi:hypothetical protein
MAAREPKPSDRRTATIIARIDPEVKEALLEEAEAQERTVSRVIERLLRDALGKPKPPKASLVSHSNNESPEAA